MVKYSIIVITYKRSDVFKSTIELLKDLRLPKESYEILILDNNVEVKVEELVKDVFDKANVNYQYFSENINMGVPLGRNYLMDRAKGEFIITLDDDIHIEDIHLLFTKVNEIFDDKTIGAIAFAIVNYYSRQKQRHEIPYPRKKGLAQRLDTYYFIGAGNAIRKEILNKTGKYPMDFGLYGGEELDLGIRIVNAGYRIVLVNDIEILHKVDENGRLNNKEKNRHIFENRIKTVTKYYPIFYLIPHILIWCLYYSVRHLDCAIPWLAFKTLINYWSNRNTISATTIKRLKVIGARLEW